MKTTVEAMRNWFRAELEKCGNSAFPETPLYWRRQALDEASRQMEKMEARVPVVEAFRELAEASGGRFDDVDPDEYARKLREE